MPKTTILGDLDYHSVKKTKKNCSIILRENSKNYGADAIIIKVYLKTDITIPEDGSQELHT